MSAIGNVYHDAWLTLVDQRDELITLTTYMAFHDYTAEDLADAVLRPWKYVDVLTQANTELAKEAQR